MGPDKVEILSCLLLDSDQGKPHKPCHQISYYSEDVNTKEERKMKGKRSLTVEEDCGGGGERSRRQNQRKKSTERKEQEKYQKEETGRAKQGREKVNQQTRIALPWFSGVGARQARCLGPVKCSAQLCPAHPPSTPPPPPLNTAINDEGGSSCGGAISS